MLLAFVAAGAKQMRAPPREERLPQSPSFRGRDADIRCRKMSQLALSIAEQDASIRLCPQRGTAVLPIRRSRFKVRIIATICQRFFFVAGRRRNDVSSTGPFSQVDGAAAWAAKRELGVGILHRFLTDRTTKFENLLAGHGISGTALKRRHYTSFAPTIFVSALFVSPIGISTIRATRS